MRMLVLAAMAVVGLVMGGCVSANDPNAVAKATTTAYNPHTGLSETTGAISPINGNIFEGFYRMRSFAGADGVGVHQVYLSVSANDWMFLNGGFAYGRPLNFVPIDRSVGSCSRYGCTINETVGINLSIEEIRQFAVSGFSFQLAGQRGSRVINIPATYFQGYASRIT